MKTTRFATPFLGALIVALAAGQLGCVVHSHPREVVYVEAAPPPPTRAVVVARPTVLVEEGASADVVVDDFYEPLSVYGVWIDDPVYGRVWQPASDMAGAGFRPYASDGRWVVNDEGDWVFVSRYHSQWGWATYHYGRWLWSDAYGWVWMPGRAWAPAWVEWRYGGGYVGWAPMGPPGVVIVESHYVFVEHVHIGSPTVYAHAVTGDRVHVAYTAANPIVEVHGHARWKAGPPARDLRSAGIDISTERVAPPAAGYVKAQGRVALDAGAERRASGRVTTTPMLRAGATAGAQAQVGPGLRPQPPAPAPAPAAPAPGQVRNDPSWAPGPSRPDSPALPSSGQARTDTPVRPMPDPGPTTRPVNPAPMPAPAPSPGATTRPVNPAPAPMPAPAPAPRPTTRPATPPAPVPAPVTRPSRPSTPPPAAPKPSAPKKRR